jgi:hypothetical protein
MSYKFVIAALTVTLLGLRSRAAPSLARTTTNDAR